ncbi:MAG TPA: hypothetical protein VFP84_16040 [Kofleriaceae bacterium]|nr:hypothetical protein [Kofleriaceae bacterium]
MSGGTSERDPVGGDPQPSVPPRKLPLKERLSVLFADYGKIAIATYFTLSILAIIGFSVAVGLGYKPTTSTGVIGVIFTGWALAKATLPIRILITLGLTPMVAHVVRRFRKPEAASAEPAAGSPPTTPSA